jgi:hypothetical protein
VRWSYLHIAEGGLCLRPPRSLVEHVGFDATATNAAADFSWLHPSLGPLPASPVRWPEAVEHPDCARLWRTAYSHEPKRSVRGFFTSLLGRLGRRP